MFINSITQLYRVDKAVVDKLRQLANEQPATKIGTRTTVHKKQGAPNETVTIELEAGIFFDNLRVATDGSGYYRADYRHIPDLPVSDAFVFDYDGAGWDFHQTTTINDFKVTYKNNELVPFPMELDEAKNKTDFEAGWNKARILQNVTDGLDWAHHELSITNISSDFKQTGVYTSRVPLATWDNNRSLVQVKVPVVVDLHINSRNYDGVLEVLRGGNVVKTYSSADLRQVRTVETDGSVSWNVLVPISTNPASNSYTFRFAFYGKNGSYPAGSSLPNIQPGSISLNLGVAVKLPEQRPSIVSPVHPTAAIYNQLRAEFPNSGTIPVYGDVVLGNVTNNPAPNPNIDMSTEMEFRINFGAKEFLNFMEVYRFSIEDYNKMIQNPGEDLAAIRVTNENGGLVRTIAMLKNMKVRDEQYIYFAELTQIGKPPLGKTIDLPSRSAQGTFPSPPDNSVNFSTYTTQVWYTILDTQEHTASISIHAENEVIEGLPDILRNWVPDIESSEWLSVQDYDVTINANSLFGEWKTNRTLKGLNAWGYALIPNLYRTVIAGVDPTNKSPVLTIKVFIGLAEVAMWQRSFTAVELMEAFGDVFTDPNDKLKVYFPILDTVAYDDIRIQTFFDPDSDVGQIHSTTVNTLISVIDTSVALVDAKFKVTVLSEAEYPKAMALAPNPCEWQDYRSWLDETNPETVAYFQVNPSLRDNDTITAVEFSKEFYDWAKAKSLIDPNYIIFEQESGGLGKIGVPAGPFIQFVITGDNGRYLMIGATANSSDEDDVNFNLFVTDPDTVKVEAHLTFSRVIVKAEATLKVTEVEVSMSTLMDNLTSASNPVVATIATRDDVTVEAEHDGGNNYYYSINGVARDFIGKKVVLPFAVDLLEATNAGNNADVVEWSVNEGPIQKATYSAMGVRANEGWLIDGYTLQPILFDLVDSETVVRAKYSFIYNPSVTDGRWYEPREVNVEVAYSLQQALISEVKTDLMVGAHLFPKVVDEPDLPKWVAPDDIPISYETINGKEWVVMESGNPSWFDKFIPVAHRFGVDLIDASSLDGNTKVVTIKHEYFNPALDTVVESKVTELSLNEIRALRNIDADYTMMDSIIMRDRGEPYGHFSVKVTVTADYDGPNGNFLPFNASYYIKTDKWLTEPTLQSELHIPSAETFNAVIDAIGKTTADFLPEAQNKYIRNPENLNNELLFLKDPAIVYDKDGLVMVRIYGDLDLVNQPGWENVSLGRIGGVEITRSFLENNHVIKDAEGKVTEVYAPLVVLVGMINSDAVVKTDFSPETSIFPGALSETYFVGRVDINQSEFEFITEPTQEQYEALVDPEARRLVIAPDELVYSTGEYVGVPAATIVRGITTEMNGKHLPTFIRIPSYCEAALKDIAPTDVFGTLEEIHYDKDLVEVKKTINLTGQDFATSAMFEGDFYILIGSAIESDPISKAVGGFKFTGKMDYGRGSPLFTKYEDVTAVQTFGRSEISCEGAENSTDWMDLDGHFIVEVNGEEVTGTPDDMTTVIQQLRDNGFEVTVDDGTRPEISCVGAETTSGRVSVSMDQQFDVWIEGVNYGSHNVGSADAVDALVNLFGEHDILFEPVIEA